MASLESINKKLQIAAENLDQAANEIRDLPLEPAKEHIRSIGQTLMNIFDIQNQIYHQNPDLQPEYLNEEESEPEPDRDLNQDEINLIKKLSDETVKKIDDTLLSHAGKQWRKVSMLVGLTMIDEKKSLEGIPDIFYAKRVQYLVEQGFFESQGNLDFMRFSEVRLKQGS